MKKKAKILIGSGVICVLLLLISSWYAITFQDSRFVAPMDFDHYTFQVQDLPMIFSISLFCIYVLTLLVILFFSVIQYRQKMENTNTMRKLNPKLGLMGLFGFLGFVGFWTYAINGNVAPFAFFIFFGFFGFYYDGKMSGTFMDERFCENAMRANLKASNIALSVIFVALIILCQGRLFKNLEYVLIATIITLSLALALKIFLSEYLLYRYDHDDQTDDSEE